MYPNCPNLGQRTDLIRYLCEEKNGNWLFHPRPQMALLLGLKVDSNLEKALRQLLEKEIWTIC